MVVAREDAGLVGADAGLAACAMNMRKEGKLKE